MRKIKILVVMLIAFALVFSMAACGGGGGGGSTGGGGGTSSSSDSGSTDSGSTGQIAAVFGSGHAEGINDKAFIQDCWTAIKKYGDESGKTYTYYQPIDDSKQSFMDTYDTAIKNGAEVIVAIGNEPSDSLKEATWDNPDVKFISIESTGFDKIAPNHFAILMEVTHAGWLSGVSMVREGFKNLGILPCVAIPPVDMWTWGWIQGANYAAGKYGVEGISLKHHYLNQWWAGPEIQTKAAAWYSDGVEVIQCNTAGGNTSIIAASDAAGAAVYGSDKDQFDEGDTVVASQVAFRMPIVYDALVSAYDGTFRGGEGPIAGGVSWCPGVESDAVGLVMEPNRFKVYNQAMYDEDFATLKNDVDGVRSNLMDVFSVATVDELWSKITTKYVTFENIE